jgi:hypothetical protein
MCCRAVRQDRREGHAEAHAARVREGKGAPGKDKGMEENTYFSHYLPVAGFHLADFIVCFPFSGPWGWFEAADLGW